MSVFPIAVKKSGTYHLSNGYIPIPGLTRTYCGLDVADADKGNPQGLQLCKRCEKIKNGVAK